MRKPIIKLFACGINEYRAAPNLDFCVNDAQIFSKIFYENIIINKENIYVIADTGKIEQTEYCKALRSFCKKAEEEDVLVVYHSGHGGVDENNDSYLMMTDSFNEATYVYTDQIIQYLNNSKAKSKVVFLDCCHSDVGDRWLPPIDTDEVVEKFYGKGISIFCSCKKQELSASENGEISVFTHFLCEALKCKHLVRNSVLYFNDLQNLVLVLANNYNRKHPDKEQTPIMRTSMIGTIAFPTRLQVEKKRQTKYSLETEDYDLLDIEFDCKQGENKVYRKYYSTKVVLKRTYTKESIEDVLEKILEHISMLIIPVTSNRQRLVENHPVEIVYVVWYNDYIDYESCINAGVAVWTMYNDSHWHKKNKTESVRDGYFTWEYNSSYDILRKMRLEDIFADDELVSFWKKQIEVVVRKTSNFVRQYQTYKAGDMTIEEFCRYAKVVYKELQDVYEACDNASFPKTNSKYKRFDSISREVIADARSLIFIAALYQREKGKEENLVGRIELEAKNYYRKLDEWNKCIQTCEETMG